MKIFNTVMKVLAALAAVAGAVYLVATYGDKIVAWAKKLLGSCSCTCECTCEEGDCTCEECDCTCEEGECTCECACEEAPAEEAPAAEEGAVEAEETDFEG